MNAQKKALIADLTGAIESTTTLTGSQPKKVGKAIDKTARKLASKLMKAQKKANSKSVASTK